MKKKLLVIFIVLIASFVVYNSLGSSGILKVFNNATVANEPNLEIGSYLVVTNLLVPKNGNFISYLHYDESLGSHFRLHRLCGLEGDVVEIKKGVLFINGENFDKKLNLIHYYKLSDIDLEKVPNSKRGNEYAYLVKTSDTTYKLALEDKFAEASGLIKNRIILEKQEIDNEIIETYNRNWNKDNFGPLKLPKGKAFVLGDNRDNSEDSRYFGLINLSHIKGKVIVP